jgi:hyperosmotically inducible periplasmic protein
MKSAALSLALSACVAVLALQACDRKAADGDSTAAKLEGAVERGKEKLAAAGEKTQEALGSASARLQPKIEAAGDRIADAAGQVTTTITTGDRTSASATPSPGDGGDARGATPGDMAITASIKAGLLKDPDLSALGIDVDTREGVVTMKGAAGDEAARTRATRIAESVKGVKEVRNHLAVKKG